MSEQVLKILDKGIEQQRKMRSECRRLVHFEDEPTYAYAEQVLIEARRQIEALDDRT